MSYQVKEIYYTLQGEGARSGRAAVLVRFAGCNLWNGLEKDRHRAVCRFCDTDFVGTDGMNGGRYSDAETLARAVRKCWPAGKRARPYAVCTGGEPLLQLDAPLVSALKNAGFEVAIETNGTIAPPSGIDWICVSPKAAARIVIWAGDELKLVFPQTEVPPERFAELDFRHFFLQPMDSPEREANTRAAAEYCLAHPQWRLSLQAHKVIGIR
ncbi:MAG: 7-carboxy-7-deazaguanine synthase [Rhizomicrobium sp.]